ncbi:unnamed protein product [Diplocarpon coronariae]
MDIEIFFFPSASWTSQREIALAGSEVLRCEMTFARRVFLPYRAFGRTAEQKRMAKIAPFAAHHATGTQIPRDLFSLAGIPSLSADHFTAAPYSATDCLRSQIPHLPVGVVLFLQSGPDTTLASTRAPSDGVSFPPSVEGEEIVPGCCLSGGGYGGCVLEIPSSAPSWNAPPATTLAGQHERTMDRSLGPIRSWPRAARTQSTALRSMATDRDRGALVHSALLRQDSTRERERVAIVASGASGRAPGNPWHVGVSISGVVREQLIDLEGLDTRGKVIRGDAGGVEGL